MIESTKGICLHYYKYSENSVIAKIFTENFGLQSYVMKGVRNKKSKNKLNVLQSLNIVQLEVTNNKKRSVQYVREIQNNTDLSLLFSDMNKRFLSLFISEILLKVLVGSEKDNSLFKFVENTVLSLNSSEYLSKNFSLVFLIKLSSYLGFYPNSEFSDRKYFDLESATFISENSYYNISDDNKIYFSSLLKNKNIEIPYQNRKELIKSLQDFYKLHHYNIDQLKSYEVIESLRV